MLWRVPPFDIPVEMTFGRSIAQSIVSGKVFFRLSSRVFVMAGALSPVHCSEQRNGKKTFGRFMSGRLRVPKDFSGRLLGAT
jgi:hypothetical protein